MRRIVSLLLVVLFLAAPVALAQETEKANDMAAGIVDGELAAQSPGTVGWGIGGFASGLFLGLIGTGVTYALAGSSNADLPPAIMASLSDRSPEYRMGFQQGYANKLRARRKSSALIGGALGTAVLVVAVISATSEDDGYSSSFSYVPAFQVRVPAPSAGW
ncbi:MAG TPA: hypothetical protein VIL18_01850 [Longimicrobiales bacterium]